METEYTHLIIGYLQRTLSPQEKDAFFQWLAADEENKRLFLEVKEIYDDLKPDMPADMERSWIKLQAKLRQRQPRATLGRVLSYAAVGLIAVLLTSLGFYAAGQWGEAEVNRCVVSNHSDVDVLELPDGSRISIGAQTRVSYPADYGKTNRTVYLEGEAFFEVAHQREKPFIVKIKGQDIEALGTKFDVMAYPQDSVYTTTLLEGSVRLTTQNIPEQTVLKPDQQLIYTPSLHSVTVADVNARDVVAWVNGYYPFSDSTLDFILGRLSRIYNVRFDLQGPALKKTLFSGTFYKGQSLKDIMEVINMSVPIRYVIKNGTVVIRQQ